MNPYTWNRTLTRMRAMSVKERPQCRKLILERRLSPYPSHMEWDGLQAIDETGERSHLSEGMRRQMARMIWQGLFGDFIEKPFPATPDTFPATIPPWVRHAPSRRPAQPSQNSATCHSPDTGCNCSSDE
jgi:hypothetical protein